MSDLQRWRCEIPMAVTDPLAKGVRCLNYFGWVLLLQQGSSPRMKKEEAPTSRHAARRLTPGSRTALQGERGAGHFHGETLRFRLARRLLLHPPQPRPRAGPALCPAGGGQAGVGPGVGICFGSQRGDHWPPAGPSIPGAGGSAGEREAASGGEEEMKQLRQWQAGNRERFRQL